MRTMLVTALVIVTSAAPATAQDMACPVRAGANLASRASPLDSTSFAVGAATVKICYGRPSLKGRTMIGGEAVPYGTVWRTGANETTKLITTGPLMVGTIELPAGMYALYTVPGESEWEVIVNKSYEQWGRENTYTDSVRAQELGRTSAKVEPVATAIETFTIRGEPLPGGSAHLILEWQNTRIRVPLTTKK